MSAVRERPFRRSSIPLHSFRRTPPSEDFFTDSLLDTSRIPSPSPPKHVIQAGTKPRRALGKRKSLKEAWDATASNSRKSSSAGSDGHHENLSLKALPSQVKRDSTPTTRRDHESTPSPHRGRPQDTLPLQSPTSDASSPPRGLAEAYQRIVDEENLASEDAAEEDIMDDHDPEEEDSAYTQPNPVDRAPMEHLRSSPSAASLRSMRRTSPRPSLQGVVQAENKENLIIYDDETSLTNVSGMSFADGFTDDSLAQKIAGHAIERSRDRERLNRAVQKDSPVFSKARVGSRSGLTTENLQRRNEPYNENERPGSAHGSVSTETSDPPLNLPKTWGTRGKVKEGWLNKIHQRKADQVNGQTPDSSKIDWISAAAKIPLPSVENGSSLEASSVSSTPTALRTRTSLDRIRQWELNDFTAQSLNVSNSPPVRVRSTVLDQLRDREIESLEKRAVTTNRLGEMRQKHSQELLRRPASVEPETVKDDTKSGSEGEAIPNTPIIVYKGPANGINRYTVKDFPPKKKRRPSSHERQDSQSLLRRLAQATSASPSPSPEGWSMVLDAKDNGIDGPDKNDAPQESDIKPKEFLEPKLVEVEATPHQSKLMLYAKTPVVTGAWVETPMPTGKRQISAKGPIPIRLPEELTDGILEVSPNGSAHISGADVKPPRVFQQLIKPRGTQLPAGALEAVLEKAKKSKEVDKNDTLNLGDNTIESLEDLLTMDDADMSTLLRLAEDTEEPKDQNPIRQTELELLERLGARLVNLKSNIHDAIKGISKLEHQVSHPKPSDTRGDWSCDTCGCTRNVVNSTSLLLPPDDPSKAPRLYLALPIPRLWHKRPGKWLPRPTRLGWVVLVCWSYWLAEVITCANYCKQEYAWQCDWPNPYCVSPDQPKWPFSFPTMLWRWTHFEKILWPVLGPLWMLLVAIGRFLAQALGLWDGFVSDGYTGHPPVRPARVLKVPVPVASDSRIPRPDWAPDLSMMDDEYL